MVFVTGGTGLIGTFLIKHLLQKGAEIKALYRQNIPALLQNIARLEWIKGDILDATLLREIIQEADAVYHCAGLVSYAPQDAEILKSINIDGTANVVNACLANSRVSLCHVSSIAALGQVKGNQPITEEAKWDGALEHSLYASSKYFGELEVWRGMAEGLKAVIVNPSIVLGPAYEINRSSTQLFKYVADEKPYYTAGNANFVDVRDVVAVMVGLMERPNAAGERYIINAGQLSYKEFFDQVASCLHKRAPSWKVPGFVTEVIWRLEWVRSVFTGQRPLITKDTARIAKKNNSYSNEKIKNILLTTFRPLPETISWCCQELIKQQRLSENVST